MTDMTRPLMLGYVRAHLLMTWDELADAKADLAHFAAAEGYTLGTVYSVRIDRAPAGLHHLAVLGAPLAMKEHLEHYTGARVITARTAS